MAGVGKEGKGDPLSLAPSLKLRRLKKAMTDEEGDNDNHRCNLNLITDLSYNI